MRIPRDQMRNLMAVSTAITIFLFGILISWMQVLHFDLANASESAKKASNNIELLLDEATKESNSASTYLSSPCTSTVNQALHRLSIDSPHVRIISLIKNGKMSCSSYAGIEPYQVNFSRYTERRLALSSGNAISPGVPILVLLSSYSQGVVATSLNTSYVAEYLTLLSVDRNFYFRVGDSILSPTNKLLNQNKLPDKIRIERSSRYPFAILYSGRTTLPLTFVIEKGWMVMGGFFIVGILSGAAVWRYALQTPTLYENLKHAIQDREIVPFYQPIISVVTKKVTGIEVLARWKHPSGIIIPPDIFIPLAEQSGLILPLTQNLMRQVANDLSPIIGRLSNPFHIGINISTAHVSHPEFINDCRDLLSKLNHSSVHLVAEITERESFESTPAFREMLLNLRKLNVSIALDDFGTGYSNLRYLNDLPINFIKIDKSFVNRIDSNPDSTVLVNCVIEMARTLRLEIIAEGVETEFQAKYLTSKGVDYLQGYFFSKPLSAVAFIRLVVFQNSVIKTF